MTKLELLILAEMERHEVMDGAFFNLRCKCGHVGTTVSRRGDFERHVAVEVSSALAAAGVAPTDEVLDQAATAAENPTPEDMDRDFINQSDVGPWLRARADAERTRVRSGN